MNEQELQHEQRLEIASPRADEIQEIRYIADRMDAIFEQQKKKLDDMDIIIFGYDREQKKNQQALVSTLQGILSDHKKIAYDTRDMYKAAKTDAMELSRIANHHKHRLASYYDFLLLKVFGIAALGGLFALLIM